MIWLYLSDGASRPGIILTPELAGDEIAAFKAGRPAPTGFKRAGNRAVNATISRPDAS